MYGHSEYIDPTKELTGSRKVGILYVMIVCILKCTVRIYCELNCCTYIKACPIAAGSAHTGQAVVQGN